MKKFIKYTDFQPISNIIDNILNSSTLSKKLKKYNLKKLWTQVVGLPFAKRSYPDMIVNKTLIVACENAQITSELSLSKRLILEKLKILSAPLHLDIQDVNFSHKSWRKDINQD